MDLVTVSSELGHETSRELFVIGRLTEFMESTDYKIIKEQYLRKVVPKENLLIELECDTEIFVCRLPETMLEDELFNLFSSVGPIYEIRLMVTPSGTYNRKFAFVRFYRQVDADEAIRKFNQYEMPKGWKMRVTKSHDNKQLFLKNIDIRKNRWQIFDAIRAEGVIGVKTVRVVLPREDNNPFHLNRGYAFVDFFTHRAAATARKDFRANLVLFNKKIIMDWAVPLSRTMYNNSNPQVSALQC